MLSRRLAALLVTPCVARALVPGVVLAQPAIRIGASISLTGTYAKSGAWGRDGDVLCQKRVVVCPEDVAAGKARFPTPPRDKR